MLHKTPGIVINHIKYKESSIIVRIFTREFGLQSYIVNGVRSKSARTKMALFQPLTLLDLVVYKNERKSLQRISEVKTTVPFQSIPFEMRKTTLAIFLSEVLSKILKEEPDEALFGYLQRSIIHLDQSKSGIENTHLEMLLTLMNFLGFHPQNFSEMGDQLRQSAYNLSAYPLSAAEEVALEGFIQAPDGAYPLSHKARVKMLHWIIAYYALHVEDFHQLKSLKVLSEVLH